MQNTQSPHQRRERSQIATLASQGVQWIRLHASTAGGKPLIPGWGAKILQAAGHGQEEIKKKK